VAAEFSRLYQKNGGAAFHRSGFSSKRLFIEAAFNRSSFSSKRLFIEAAFHETYIEVAHSLNGFFIDTLWVFDEKLLR
jgi:hypothetical protein